MDSSDPLETYILRHSDPEGEYLHALYRAAHLRLLYPRMVPGAHEGRLLRMLVRMIRPHRVLEIGTYSGYSTLSMAEGLEAGAHIHTIEKNDELEDFLRQWLLAAPLADRITLHMGDALEIIPQLDETWDLVFIDADKRQYPDYYRLTLPRLRPGGFILADNTLWDGHVLEPDPRSAQTIGIQAFNDMVAADPRVDRVVLPLRDGITLIRKR